MSKKNKNIRIVVKHDLAKESREMSRNVFAGVNMKGKTHKDKARYTRKDKHKGLDKD